MIRIFHADDHPIVRHGMKRLIEEHPDLRVIGQAANGRQVLQAENKDDWDILLLDLSLPRVNGLEVLRRLRAERPTLKIVILSALAEAHYGAQALREGADAFLSKAASPVELIRTLRTVALGERVVPVEPPSGPREPHTTLSAREYQVFMLIVEGRSSTEIAAELNIVASTVSNHLARVKERLGCATVAEIVSYAHRVGLASGGLEPP